MGRDDLICIIKKHMVPVEGNSANFLPRDGEVITFRQGDSISSHNESMKKFPNYMLDISDESHLKVIWPEGGNPYPYMCSWSEIDCIKFGDIEYHIIEDGKILTISI